MKLLLGGLGVACLLSAQVANPNGPQPIYRVQVVQRTVQAVNYGHRTEPTRIDLKGTVLATHARGEAKVESRRGAVEIEAKVEKLDPPTRFGREYLTYVLWAITPEGRPVNLGEVVPDPDNKAKLKVSTDLQSFALIVTAEPYFSVTQPSDVVVMENALRPDTVGKAEEVTAKYELMPRGHYTYVQPTDAEMKPPAGQKLSMDKYEAVVALYQALNAIQIARAAGADRQASDTMKKAEELYEQARSLQSQNGTSRQVVMTARQAAQAAEDARLIASKHHE
jgi:hypothetical protein